MQSKFILMCFSLALVFSLASACKDLKPIGTKGSKSTVADSDKVKLEMYIMSKCPFGVQAVQGIKPVLDEVGDYVDFHLNYIANEQNGKFSSLHGEPEAKGDMIQLCAMKKYPEQSTYMKFLD